MTLSNKTNNGCGIVQIQWSYTKPCVFYTRDRRNTIDIWNLEKSDLKPIESIKIRDPISFMSLVPIKEASNKVHKSYMVSVLYLCSCIIITGVPFAGHRF